MRRCCFANIYRQHYCLDPAVEGTEGQPHRAEDRTTRPPPPGCIWNPPNQYSTKHILDDAMIITHSGNGQWLRVVAVVSADEPPTSTGISAWRLIWMLNGCELRRGVIQFSLRS